MAEQCVCGACGRELDYAIKTIERDSGIVTGDRQKQIMGKLRIFDPEYVVCSCGRMSRMKDIHNPFAELQE